MYDECEKIVDSITRYCKNKKGFWSTKDYVYSSLMAIEDEVSTTGVAFDPSEIRKKLDLVETDDDRGEALVKGAREVLEEVRERWKRNPETTT